jgi:hypothetical protein
MVAATRASFLNERRMSRRRQPTLGTLGRLALKTGERLIGLVWNISPTGLSMLVNRRLELGASFPIELSTRDEAHVLSETFCVAHVLQMRTGDYVVGGFFGRNLTPAEMSPFVTLSEPA